MRGKVPRLRQKVIPAITDRKRSAALLRDQSAILPVTGLNLCHRYGSMYVDTDVVVLQDPLAPPYVQTSYDVQVTVQIRGQKPMTHPTPVARHLTTTVEHLLIAAARRPKSCVMACSYMFTFPVPAVAEHLLCLEKTLVANPGPPLLASNTLQEAMAPRELSVVRGIRVGLTPDLNCFTLTPTLRTILACPGPERLQDAGAAGGRRHCGRPLLPVRCAEGPISAISRRAAWPVLLRGITTGS